MDSQLVVEQLLQLFLPVALILLGLHVAANMTGFGKKIVQKLTKKAIQGMVIIAAIWIVIALLSS